MKRVVNAACFSGLLISAGIMLAMSIYWRFTNIDMTETRLVLEHWREYLAFFVAFIAFGIGYKGSDE